MPDSEDRYFAKPADVPGCFTLWDRRSDSAVYGFERTTKKAVEAFAARLNAIYRQLKHGGSEALGDRR